MRSDEQQIRDLVSTWMTATAAGDVEAVLSLMADDVVFLAPGQPIMRKDDFAAAMRGMRGPHAPKFEGRSEIQEIKVAITRKGTTLSVLQRENGRWVISRDANMLVTTAATALKE